MPDDEDLKVKQLLDAQTEADLARWFSLPSFQQLAEQTQATPAEVVDPEMQAVIERRRKASAAVDPALLDAILARTLSDETRFIKFQAKLDVVIDEQFGVIDEVLVQRALQIAEPREVEIPDELNDDLKECTPQALLRDLHRAELYFEKQFEVVDFSAEQRFDIVAAVKDAMATSWKLPQLEGSPVIESRALLDGVRADRRRKWTEYLPALRNRRVRE